MTTPPHPVGAGWRRAWRAATAIGRGLARVVQAVVAVIVLGGLTVGLPWVLVRFIGWPLPDHVPSLDELEMLLVTPPPVSLYLDAVACVTWLIWVLFALDVAGCVLDVARGARWSDLAAQVGPLRRVSTVLVGSLLVAFLSRTAIAAPATSAAPDGHHGIVATAVQHQPEPVAADPAGTERVREPRDGIHDSLYRVAQRCLGDGDRWPEIWALNRGSAQPGGRTLTTPSLVHPGDLLRLPQTSAAPDLPAISITPPAPPPQPVPKSPAPPTPPSEAPTPPTPSAEPQEPSIQDPAAGPSAPAVPVGAVAWGTEVFVSLGLAAAVSAALVAARRRHRARYRPGSGRRGDDPPVAPVIYQLHQAHQHAQHHDDDADLAAETHHTTADSEASDLEPARHSRPEAASVQVLPRHRRRTLGHDDPGSPRRALAPDIALTTGGSPSASGPEHDAPHAEAGTLALDLARAHGLGLVGPGGYAAARALLLTLLATTPAVTVLVPAADLTRLLGTPHRANGLPDAIRVVDDLAAALTDLEPLLAASAENAATGERIVLVTSPPRDAEPQARVQALLDTGSRTGITALILGQWRPGVTAYITADGTIAATDPGLGEPLRGTRAFTLPDTAARDLLAALRDTTATTPSHTAAPIDTAPDAPSTRTHDFGSTSETDTGQAAAASDRGGLASPGLEITSTPSTDTEASRVMPADRAAPEEEPSSPVSGQTTPLTLAVFGAPTLTWRRDGPAADHVEISGGFSPRLTELLVFLAVHPGGVSRDAVVDALWAEHAPRDPASVLRTVISRIRRAVEQNTDGALSEIVLADRGRYRLAAELVEVDYWTFSAALTRRRTATTEHARTAASEAIVAAYGGALADGLDADWLTAAREATRRAALDAVAALARAHVHDNPDSTLDLLETARAFDPHNELLYRDIMRLEHTLGRHDAISRTLTLLETRLREIDAIPTPATVDLATRLRDLHTDITTPPPQPSAPHDRHGH